MNRIVIVVVILLGIIASMFSCSSGYEEFKREVADKAKEEARGEAKRYIDEKKTEIAKEAYQIGKEDAEKQIKDQYSSLEGYVKLLLFALMFYVAIRYMVPRLLRLFVRR